MKIEIGNARSRITGLPDEIFRLLRHELSYVDGEPGVRSFTRPDGSISHVSWDGYRRLLGKNGIMPSGLVPRAYRLLGKWGIPIQVEDRRQVPEEQMPRYRLPTGFELRDYQLRACNDAIRMGRGVIDSPPRTGKTIMIAEMVRRVSGKTVITSPTEPIAQQTLQKLRSLLLDWSCPGDEHEAGMERDFFLLTGGPPKTRKAQNEAGRARVFVATAETSIGMSEHWWSDVECLIVDERHHQAAKTYRKMNDLALNAYWRWGFTGTDFRSNPGEQVALEACLGRTVARYTIKEMIGRGVLVPARVEFWPINAADVPRMMTTKFAKAYKTGVVESQFRNDAVVAAAIHHQGQGRHVLILVHRIDHGERLQQMIPGSRFVQGADGPEVRAAVAELDAGKLRCLIGSPVVGEGLDCPSADCLIYAKGYKARVTHTQDTFRVLTADGQKKDAVIVDFADRHNGTLLDHSVERMRNYQAMGMHVDVFETIPVDTRQLSLYNWR